MALRPPELDHRGEEIHGKNRTRTTISANDYTVEDRGYETPCWMWKGNLDREGYPNATGFRGQRIRPCKVAYELAHGPLPPGLTIDHLCRQRACVNGGHMEGVSAVENVLRGSHVKLSAPQVQAIRSAGGTDREVAERFGISQPHANRVRRGLRWK